MIQLVRDRKGDQRGVNGSQFKILANWSFGLIPKCTPNPRVLGTVWSSYGGAIPTQESPRNTHEPTWKQTAKRSSWKYARYTHRLNRRAQRHLVGLTDAQSLQQWKSPHRLNRRYGLNCVGLTGDRAPDDPTKSITSAGVVVQRDTKTRCWAPVKPMLAKPKHRCSCPESLQSQTHKASVKPTSRKVYTPVKRVKQQQKNPNSRNSYSPVEPTHQVQSVGLTGDR